MARSYAGSTDGISRSGTPFGTIPFTLAVWARFTTIAAGDHCFVGVYNTGDDDGFRLSADWDGSTKRCRMCSKQGGIPQNATVSAGITDTNWHSYIGTVTATNRRDAWVDNSTTGNNTSAVTPPTITNLGIGIRLGGSNDRNNGHELARVCAWDVDIGAAGRAAYHAGVDPRSILPDNLVLYVEDIRDAVDLCNNGALTVTGTTVVAHPRLYFHMPAHQIRKSAAAATFNAAWNVAANTVIQSGARAA